MSYQPPPHLNLYGVAGILMILLMFMFLTWLLGGIAFKFLIIVGILFGAAVFFAKMGNS